MEYEGFYSPNSHPIGLLFVPALRERGLWQPRFLLTGYRKIKSRRTN